MKKFVIFFLLPVNVLFLGLYILDVISKFSLIYMEVFFPVNRFFILFEVGAIISLFYSLDSREKFKKLQQFIAGIILTLSPFILFYYLVAFIFLIPENQYHSWYMPNLDYYGIFSLINLLLIFLQIINILGLFYYFFKSFLKSR